MFDTMNQTTNGNGRLREIIDAEVVRHEPPGTTAIANINQMVEHAQMNTEQTLKNIASAFDGKDGEAEIINDLTLNETPDGGRTLQMKRTVRMQIG